MDPTQARRRRFDMRAVVEEIVATLQSPLQQAVVDMQIEIASAIARQLPWRAGADPDPTW